MDYEFHPIANRFPLMDEAQFKRLVESMKSNGYDPKKPIFLLGNKILDGRNRYRAINKLGIAGEFVEWSGQWGTPEEFVLKENFHRCHYSKDALAMIAAAAHEEAKATSRKSASTVADEHGVSETKLHKAKRVSKNATPAVRKLVESGLVSLDDAEAASSLPPEVQEEAARKVESGSADSLEQGAKGDAFEPNAQEPPPTDQVGKPIPPHLRDVFATTIFDTYLGHIKSLRKLTDVLRKESPFFLDATGILADLTNMEEKCRNSRPHVVCQQEDCRGKGCEICRASGWLPEWRHDEMKFGS